MESKEYTLKVIREELVEKRETVLDKYIESVKAYDPSNVQSSMDCVNTAGLLHDIDRHIKNIDNEILRLEAINFIVKQNESFVSGTVTNG